MDNVMKKVVHIPRNLFLPEPPELAVSVVCAEPKNGTLTGENYTFVPHTHDFMELVVVRSGTGTQLVNGNLFPVFRGDVFLLRGDMVHCFIEHKNLQLYNILFMPNEMPLPYALLRKMSGYQMFFLAEPSLRSARDNRCGLHLPPEKTESLEQMVRRLEETLAVRREGFEARALSLLLNIILMISESSQSAFADTDGTWPRIVAVIGRMENEFTRDWSLPELAELACTSPRNFLRLFAKVTGSSPINYLLHLRVTRAAELLRRGCSVAEASERCGFCDVSYFGKTFKRIHGLAPRNFCPARRLKP